MIVEVENNCLQDVIPCFQERDCYKLFQHHHILADSGRKFRLTIDILFIEVMCIHVEIMQHFYYLFTN